ncbi:hypothetical protein BMR11_17660, partial [Methylococcaceae bacterium CS5]
LGEIFHYSSLAASGSYFVHIPKFVGRGFSPPLNMAVSLVESCWVTRGELTSVGLMFRSEYAK